MVIKNILELLINPFFLCLFCLGMSVLFLRCRHYSITVHATLFVVFIAFLIISTGWLPRYLTSILESQYSVVTQVDSKIRWIVVLGGGHNEVKGLPANDLLTSASIKRLIEGVRLFRALPRSKLILSGGGAFGEQPEAVLLAELSVWFSIPIKKVILELKAINTAEQAHELKSIIGDQPFYLITSAIHMPRSMALCQQQGLHPIAAPTDFTFYWSTDNWSKLIIPNPYNIAYFSIALHEILGRIWGYIMPLDLPPTPKTKPIENYNLLTTR